MSRFFCTSASIIAAASVAISAATSAHAGTFTLFPVTNTTPNFAGTIQIMGTVTMAPGESMLSPTLVSTINLPFLSNFSAGFNGTGQGFDPAFLAWNGLGVYSGAIFDHQISTNNLGYAGGMPLGFYGTNPIGPGGLASIVLSYTTLNGATQPMTATYAVNVVPTPSVLAVLGVGGLMVTRRRRA